MSREPAHGPGRDDVPARHAPEPAGNAPEPPFPPPADQAQPTIPGPAGEAGEANPPTPGPADEAQPAAPGPPDDEPLAASNQDWMDDAEWAAYLAASEAEEEPVDPDLEDEPPDWEALDAVIEEAREITAAEIRARIYAARMVAGGGFGPVGAAPGPRGPGLPGSARSFPGEHASPVAGFGGGRALDVAPGCIALAEFADAVAGEDDRYPGATDDEIVGVICALSRVESHIAARKLAAVAEFLRRRPAEDSVKGTSQAPAQDSVKGTAQDPPEEAAGRPAAEGPAAAADRLPEQWDEFAVDELSCALAESKAGAERIMDLARELKNRLPATMTALLDGAITLAKAAIIARATQFLDTEEAAAAEAMVLGRAGRLTPPGLRAAIARAVMEVAPKKAKKRREEAAERTRVERWMEDTGNAGLAGRELPPAEVLAADQRITAWAKELRAAGLGGDMDVLRARAYLDILLGTDSRPAPSAPQPPPANPWDYRPPVGPLPDGSDGPFPAAPFPAGFAARLNLTVPLATVLGLADRPGEVGLLGPIDPWLARDLARSAAQNPTTTWCVTVTDQHGHAIGHGCARPAPKDPAKPRQKQRKPGPPGSHHPSGGPGPPGGPVRQRFSVTAIDDRGPPGGYGTWRLSTGIPGQRDLVITIGPVATGECDHRHQARGHDPGVLLRHLTEVRHATCTAPACRRPASQCDFEHNTPYEAGGRTCMCNGGPKCRHHHRLKQNPRWTVEQPAPAVITWTTPAGRQYTTEPTRYPI